MIFLLTRKFIRRPLSYVWFLSSGMRIYFFFVNEAAEVYHLLSRKRYDANTLYMIQAILFLSFVGKMLRNSINTTEYYTLWWSICTEIFFILILRYVFIDMFVLIFCMPALLIFNWCDVIFIVAQIRLLE